MNAARWFLLGVLLVMGGLLAAWAYVSAPKFPVARIRVVDPAGRPVAGAVIQPDGMRTKPGPYDGGHYGWLRVTNGPPSKGVTTDRDGVAWVPYPKYVFERIETGQISFSVSHPEFVSDRPFRVVSTVPPFGAPLKVWWSFVMERVQLRTLVARTDPVVLQPGATIEVSAVQRETVDRGSRPENGLFALISNQTLVSEDFWSRPAPGVLRSRQVAPGSHLILLIEFDDAGIPSFSDVVPVTASVGLPTVAQIELKRGVILSGQIDPSIRRPITQGRVIARVTPAHSVSKDQPPDWQAWTRIREDGSFRFDSLPAGKASISAICDGFISTNGSGTSMLRTPQSYEIGPRDTSIVIGMEQTARLEVAILGPGGKPVPNATVQTWPNIHYEGRGSTIFGTCFNTADLLRRPPKREEWFLPIPSDFTGNSDSNGLAVVPNLPAEVRQFAVGHPTLQLPAINTGSGEKRREGSVTLARGQAHHVTITLEPKTASQISHY